MGRSGRWWFSLNCMEKQEQQQLSNDRPEDKVIKSIKLMSYYYYYCSCSSLLFYCLKGELVDTVGTKSILLLVATGHLESLDVDKEEEIETTVECE